MREVADGIFQIVLPTPWPVGPVNVYLIDDEPLTLFDTGPIDGSSFAALELGLAECGYRVEDLGSGSSSAISTPTTGVPGNRSLSALARSCAGSRTSLSGSATTRAR